MTRVILIGGFLGAGKTTLIGEVIARLGDAGQRVGVVTNDQAAHLVDTALLAAVAEEVGEVAGACFCCSFDQFIAQLKRLDENLSPDVLIGEPVGSCTDLSATVVRPLQRYYADLFDTAPYSVLLDPQRFREAFGPAEERSFPDDVLYIYRLQIEEADAILLNKSDLLSADEVAALKTQITRSYPGRPVFAVSAATGAGVGEWLEFVLGSAVAGERTAVVDYDRYAAGEAALGWLNAAVRLTALRPTDWQQFCRRLLQEIQQRLTSQAAEIAHAKVLISAGEQWIAGNLTQNNGEVHVRGDLPPTVSAPNAIINVRAHAPAQVLQDTVRASLRAAAGAQVIEEIRELQSLTPSRPRPTHRLTT